jgi:hypothetical protein
VLGCLGRRCGGRNDDNWNWREAPVPSDDLEKIPAVHDRHPKIEQNEMYVCRERPENVEGSLTVGRLEDSEPDLLEHLAKSCSHIEIIIDNERGRS